MGTVTCVGIHHPSPGHECQSAHWRDHGVDQPIDGDRDMCWDSSSVSRVWMSVGPLMGPWCQSAHWWDHGVGRPVDGDRDMCWDSSSVSRFTIILSVPWWAPIVLVRGWDPENSWGSYSTSLVGWLDCASTSFLANSFLSSACCTSRPFRNPDSDGTCRRHSDAQVSKGIRHSAVRALYLMVPLILGICAIYIT